MGTLGAEVLTRGGGANAAQLLITHAVSFLSVGVVVVEMPGLAPGTAVA